VNKVLKVQGSGDLGPNRVVERPHVLWVFSSSFFLGDERIGGEERDGGPNLC